MQNKTTDELGHEIKAATDIEDYLESNQENLILQNLPEYLGTLLSCRKITKADIVRGSLLSKAYVYQIFSGEKNPSRDKLIALAFGMRLSEEETQTLLKLSKNAKLYARDKRDSIILFALQRKMSILKVNDLLFRHGFDTLGIQEE